MITNFIGIKNIDEIFYKTKKCDFRAVLFLTNEMGQKSKNSTFEMETKSVDMINLLLSCGY